jgi:hypothetical protein
MFGFTSCMSKTNAPSFTRTHTLTASGRCLKAVEFNTGDTTCGQLRIDLVDEMREGENVGGLVECKVFAK